MFTTDPTTAAAPIAQQIAAASAILLLTHVSPDGDAIGSMLGLWHALNDSGKKALPLASSALPSYVMNLPGIEHVTVYQSGQKLPEHDLVIMVDTASLSRVALVFEEHREELLSKPIIIIDHHATNDGAASLNLIDSERASCAELVYDLLKAMGLPISAASATCLQMGIITDTQSYQTHSTNGESLRVSAELLPLGADQRQIVHDVYFNSSYNNLIAIGRALGEMQREGEILWANLTQELLRSTGAEDDVSDDIVKMMQRCSDGRICVLFKERYDGTVKISLRSHPGFDVSVVAQTWGGGGHRQAAGATLKMGLEDARREVLARLREAL